MFLHDVPSIYCMAEIASEEMLGQSQQRVWRPWAAENGSARDEDNSSRQVPSQSRTVTREHVPEHVPGVDEYKPRSSNLTVQHQYSYQSYDYPPQQHHHQNHVPSMSRSATPHYEPYSRPWTPAHLAPAYGPHSAPTTPHSSPPQQYYQAQHAPSGWSHSSYSRPDYYRHPQSTPPPYPSSCTQPCCAPRASYGPSGHPDSMGGYYSGEPSSQPCSRVHSPQSGSYSPGGYQGAHNHGHAHPTSSTPPPAHLTHSAIPVNSAPVVKIRRGITSIEEVIKQFERGEGPQCPPLKDWSVDMRRRERSTYSQRKKLYEEYLRLGSVEAFYKEYGSMSIGKIYALISSRSRKQRANASAMKAAAIREAWGKGAKTDSQPTSPEPTEDDS